MNTQLTLLEYLKILFSFMGYVHQNGCFDFQFDNFEDGWRYATVELYYSKELGLGHVSLGADEILPFKGFSCGERIF